MKNYIYNINSCKLDEMIRPIISSLEEISASEKSIYQIHLALEEILVNIIEYAYQDKKGEIKISFDIKENNINVIIKDKGVEFNPLSKEDPNLNESINNRSIGGLGIYIIKNIVDEIKYERTNNENVLSFKKSI